MNKIFIVEMMGRLGNQLFQYAFFLSLKKRNLIVYLDIDLYRSFPDDLFQLNRIFSLSPDDILSESLKTQCLNFPKSNIRVIHDSEQFVPIQPDFTEPVIIYRGYWQSEKYFKNVIPELSPRIEQDALNCKTKQLLSEIWEEEKSVSIHIRRGDYLKGYQNNYMYGSICTMDYYNTAIRQMESLLQGDIRFYIFSDDPEWAKTNFTSSKFIIIDWNKGEDSWQDLFLMTQCKHNIIANSSFSWWGAWLNKNPQKIVIGPDPWLNVNDTLDIIPDTWRRIYVKDKKEVMDLRDTTFLIPLRIDSKEREANLDSILEYIFSLGDASIIILEADKKTRYRLKKNYSNVELIYIEDSNPVFHRTFYLNKLIQGAKTSIVGIWDTDVIVPPSQIAASIRQIRNKKAVMSFPYDGNFFYVSEDLSKDYRKHKKVAVLEKKMYCHALVSAIPSVGGAFFVDREIYQQAGGENEHFYGWGNEDMERIKRMEILDLPVFRSNGPLFHLYHPRNNSVFTDFPNQLKSYQELLHVCRMTKEELEKYIQTWNHL